MDEGDCFDNLVLGGDSASSGGENYTEFELWDEMNGGGGGGAEYDLFGNEIEKSDIFCKNGDDGEAT